MANQLPDPIFNTTAGAASTSAQQSILQLKQPWSQPWAQPLNGSGIHIGDPPPSNPDWLDNMLRNGSGGGGIAFPSTGAPLGPASAPWTPTPIKETPEVRANGFIFDMNCLVEKWSILKDMTAALNRELATAISMGIATSFDLETNEFVARLQITGFSETRTLISVKRIVRHVGVDTRVCEEMLAEMHELIMLQGVLNMAKAEFNLNDQPAF